MNKAKLLRQHLETTLPSLKNDPDALLVFIDKGSFACTQSPSLSYEYRYDLNIIITDCNLHADELIIPLLVWIRENQPDLLTGNHDEGMGFEADILSHSSADISFTLKLTERVIVSIADGQTIATHVGEPQLYEPEGVTGWEMYVGNIQVID
jgi:hypothetical protein